MLTRLLLILDTVRDAIRLRRIVRRERRITAELVERIGLRTQPGR